MTWTMLLPPPAAGNPAACWLLDAVAAAGDAVGVAVEPVERVPVAAATPLTPSSKMPPATTYGIAPRLSSDLRASRLSRALTFFIMYPRLAPNRRTG